MLQLLQNLGNGETLLAEVPAPLVQPGHLLIATSRTLVSAGTERMLVDFGRASLLDKARQQPDKVRMVLDKVRTDGLFATLDAVRSKLDQPLALGYCNVGTVIETGRGVEGFAAGDRVVSNGPHAEVVRVPQNLCAKVPDAVDDESAAFTVLASIGLQGIRLAAPTLGENVVVTGLGLIGLLTVQLLRANGCNVLGIDLEPKRLELARSFGAFTCDVSRGEDPVAAGLALSGGRGVDAVLITASTKSSQPVEQAAKMSRKRGRIVLVGVTGLELNRSDFYEKELTFQVSCSYGPGRYDPSYEQRSHDYPFGLVRWTEQRNFEAVLGLMGSKLVDTHALITHRYALREAGRAYETLLADRDALGIVLSCEAAGSAHALAGRSVRLGPAPDGTSDPQQPVVAMVGAGNYGSRVLLPALARTGARLDTIVTSAGVSGVHHGKRAGFEFASTDFREGVLSNPRINTVIIASRHDTHADLAAQCIAAGRNVFVEKPLALDEDSLDRLAALAATDAGTGSGSGKRLMVGFNRRFSPLVLRLKGLLESTTAPKSFIYTVNAGNIPADHWTQDREVGGGRILGEACHFVDLLRHLAGNRFVAASITTMGPNAAPAGPRDTASISLSFEDGSIGSIHYFANGAKAFPKERLEVFCGGGVLVLDNFVRLTGHGWPGFARQRLLRQDKGQSACIAAFIDAVRTGKSSPIPLDELIEVSRISVRLADAQKEPTDRIGAVAAV